MADDADKDKSSKLNTILQFLGSLLTPLSVALVGFYGSQYLANRQDAETNVRLYAELMSKREETDSALRKDMFNSIIANFLKPNKEKQPEQAVLNLELLAYNFHESLDLAPLFREVYEKITAGKQSVESKHLIERLDKVTREVMNKQISMLEESGVKVDGVIDFKDLEQNPAGLDIIPTKIELEQSPVWRKLVPNKNVGLQPAEKKDFTNAEITVKIQALEVDYVRRAVRFRIRVQPINGKLSDFTYWFGYYDFPMLNNIRLPQGYRCAIVFNEFLADTIAQVTFLYFPGSRASLKDKPYYDEVINDLLRTRKGLNDGQ